MKHWINAIVFLLTASLGSLFASAFLAQESEERVRYYEKWLKQDVLYIVTPDEQDVFEKLTTFDEKDNFIEQFWSGGTPILGRASMNSKRNTTGASLTPMSVFPPDSGVGEPTGEGSTSFMGRPTKRRIIRAARW